MRFVGVKYGMSAVVPSERFVLAARDALLEAFGLLHPCAEAVRALRGIKLQRVLRFRLRQLKLHLMLLLLPQSPAEVFYQKRRQHCPLF